MIYEIITYLILICILNAKLRIIHAKKNGCFYGKTLNPIPERLKTEINNIHYLATPEWYLQASAQFFSIFAIVRLLIPALTIFNIILEILSVILVVLGTSGSVSYHWQKWINIGSNLPDDWDYANGKSEFALSMFSKKISFWWKRPFSGKMRKWVEVIGILSIVVGLALIIILYL